MKLTFRSRLPSRHRNHLTSLCRVVLQRQLRPRTLSERGPPSISRTWPTWTLPLFGMAPSATPHWRPPAFHRRCRACAGLCPGRLSSRPPAGRCGRTAAACRCSPASPRLRPATTTSGARPGPCAADSSSAQGGAGSFSDTSRPALPWADAGLRAACAGIVPSGDSGSDGLPSTTTGSPHALRDSRLTTPGQLSQRPRRPQLARCDG